MQGNRFHKEMPQRVIQSAKVIRVNINMDTYRGNRRESTTSVVGGGQVCLLLVIGVRDSVINNNHNSVSLLGECY